MAQGSLLCSSEGTQAVQVVSDENVASDAEHHRARDAFRKTMVRSKTPPPRLSHGNESDAISPLTRGRTNSREYTHSYDGNYGAGNDDMIGVDLARTSLSWWSRHQANINLSYVLGTFLLEMFVGMVLTTFDEGLAKMSFTVTNVIHFFAHLVYLHWLKGGYGELQGDLEAMTLWEQIEATPGTGSLRLLLRFVPTVLCYCACIAVNWEWKMSFFNGLVWVLTELGKLPWMNGVRIFKINAHPVIGKDD
jgi:ORMDL family